MAWHPCVGNTYRSVSSHLASDTNSLPNMEIAFLVRELRWCAFCALALPACDSQTGKGYGMKNHKVTAVVVGLAVVIAALVPAHAGTFAVDTQLSTVTDMNLSGLTLTGSGNVLTTFTTPTLAPFGNLPASWSLTGTETGAIAFGPIALASFDGTYRLTYTGPAITIGSVTLNPGNVLLSATYLGSVLTGYGSTASLVDSVLSGGIVSYSSDILTFDSQKDQGFSLGLTSASSPLHVVGGQLSNFSAVSQGGFSADILNAGGSAVGVAGGAVAPVNAMTIGMNNPVDSGANVALSGLALTSSSATNFTFSDSSPALRALGSLPAILNLNATETGAIAFGPIALASFDGTYSIIYAGPAITAGGITVNPGDDLLSANFLGAVFDGYGSAGSLVDSTLAGGIVSYSSDFLTFDPLADQGLSLGFTSASSPFQVVGGQLSNFSAVSQGAFAATFSTESVPEPATWALLLIGLGGLSLGGRRTRVRRRP